MRYKYYNDKEFSFIMNLNDKEKYEEMKNLFEDYMLRYPNDQMAKIYYIDVLLKLGSIEEAGIALSFISESDIYLDREKAHEDLENLAMVRIKYLISIEEYQEAYDILCEYKESFSERGWRTNGTEILLQKHLGLKLTREHHTKYLYKQIIDYKEEEAINHIIEHNYSDEESKFSEDFPIEKVVKQVREVLPLDDRIIRGTVDNLYVFKYDGCGKTHGKNTDYFMVVAIAGTNNVISIYPYNNIRHKVHYDLTPELEVDKGKVLSRIMKFNQKYDKKNID